MRRLPAVALVVVSLVAAGCGSSSGSSSAPSSSSPSPSSSPPSSSGPAATTEPAGPPYEVVVEEETYVDAERDRTIATRIAHPTGGGPYPLLVMSHGFTGHPDEYAETIPLWAADGFVVAAPTFPRTNRDAPGVQENIGDVENQPGDVSHVIDEVLAASEDPASPLHGLVDPEAIGVVGHSLGGATTWAVSFDSATRDDRIDSTVVFAGLTMPMPGGTLEPSAGHPLLVLHGDADDVPIVLDHDPWDAAAGPKWFVTLHGAEHRLAFVDEPSPYDDLVTRTVLAFWHGTLDGDASALESVSELASDPELSTVEHVEG